MKKIAACPSKPWRSGAIFVKSVVSCQLSVVIFLAFLFSLFTLTLTFAKPAHAATCQIPANATSQETINAFNKCAIEKNIFDDKIFNFNQISGTTDSLYTMLIGNSLLHPETDEITQGKGAVAATGRLVAGLYSTPPASGVGYFADQIQRFNPIQPVYAQAGGIGFGALSPVQDIWRVFRNASYVGFVIVFVIMGFMIMFRAHISPQAVATVQDSIPRIVIALILVTFSYAIAGLMIDLMFLIINIAINLFAQSGFIKADKASEVIFNKSIIGVIIGAWPDIFTTTAEALKILIDDVIDFGGDILGIIEWGVSCIAALIVGIAALFIMFRIFLMLLMAYVMIIILTMFAPFFFLIQALPGNTGAKEWFKQMAANIAVFPTVSLMIIFAGAIGGISAFGGTGAGELQGVGSEALKFPLLVGGLNPGAIGKIIALGFLFMTPEAANLVKNAIGAKGPQFGGAGAAALGAGAAVIGRPLGAPIRAVGQAASWGMAQGVVAKYGERVPFLNRSLKSGVGTRPPPLEQGGG